MRFITTRLTVKNAMTRKAPKAADQPALAPEKRATATQTTATIPVGTIDPRSNSAKASL